ncbi:prolyl oligopeptidase family serine peptidase [Sphingomonas sp. ID1715]|uniref:prolyl oligopeptidase family serine peptidase n=1 Tax=Sphingomonas sp. ID1715 TaxID=1656898 RepID=UPI00148942B7|nr:prolyl oligopeptidase family serine peptidase [Sphingomonas sp. ID1715]NNM78359.1 prolyl oligopeptidase family serine peptidase [Sphingomonas sp. ID1715]
MIRASIVRSGLSLLAVCAAGALAAPPPAPIEPVTDDYYGTKITDPYRWMESGKDSRWMPWLKSQADATRATFESVPGRAAFLKDAEALSGAVTTVQKVVQAGPHRLIQRRDAGAQDTVIYVRTGNGAERVLVDPAKVAGGDQVIDWWQASPKGRYVAVGLSKRGSEASILHIVDTATGQLLPDRIPNTDFGIFGWLPDESGFTYLTFVGEKGTPTYYVNNSARLHRLGASGPDAVLIDRAKPPVPLTADQFQGVFVSPDSDTALLGVWDGRSERAVYRADRESVVAGKAGWSRVADFDDLIVDVALSGDALWLVSRKDDSNGRLLLTSAKAPSLAAAKPIAIPGNPVIESITASKSGAILKTLEGGKSALWRVGRDGVARRIVLPVSGTVRWVETDLDSDGGFVSLGGWFAPAQPYRLDGDRLVDLGLVKAPAALDPTKYEARELIATARDGTKVPYTVLARKGLVTNGRNPLIIEAYGSYGYSMTPAYRSQMIPFLDRGGVYVEASVRGGGEFGRKWHYAGKAETKANTWRDAIDVAEELVRTKLTSPEYMTILGTSAGGVMVGQAVNERPDLFTGAVANVGFMNPIRYVSEQNFADIQEWGGPITDARTFKIMYDLDAYEHVKPGTRYPATLVVSGINDPRAATFHGAKYAAKLAASTTSGEPVLLRIDFDAGHGIGSTRSQLDQVWTDIFSFALWQAGRSEFAPKP